MTFHRTFRTVAAVASVAVATTFGAGVALAQPHGPHGHPGGDGVEIGALIAHAKDKLALNTSQQGMFDKAVADSKAARAAGKTLHDQVKATLTAELAKPEPDLAAVAALADGARQQNAALRTSARDAWLALYATFSPEQKAVVRDALKSGIERMQAHRAAHAAPQAGSD